jgi:hypothetical protein
MKAIAIIPGTAGSRIVERPPDAIKEVVEWG